MNKLRKKLRLLLPAMRISLALTLLTACILLAANVLGYTLDEDAQALENRIQIAESLTIQFSVMIPQRDVKRIEELIQLVTKRNPALLSTGIRRASGRMIFQTPGHERFWQGYSEDSSNTTHIMVPLMNGNQVWGKVELRFKDLKGASLFGFLQKEFFRLILFCSVIGFFAYLIFMLRTLRQLDPSAVIPGRVNAAFDTLSEGVMIIDEDEQILLTNKAFTEAIGRESIDLLGYRASEMKWKCASKKKSRSRLPWMEVLENGEPIVGAPFDLISDKGETIKYAINAAPILGTDGKAQGVLVTLDDITRVEKQNVQLKSMVNNLEESQAVVQEQNKELSYLATRDALTGCLNRRAFTDGFDRLFNAARANSTELCCIMVDLDHFKLVNDNYGHAVGDEVIILLAEILTSNTRQNDLVGRYGGEEFCLVLPGMSLDNAFKLAERIRLRVIDESSKRYENGPQVAASVGIASILDNPDNPGALNIFADEALYCAKENGRNRVVCYASIADIEAETAELKAAEKPRLAVEEPEIENLQNRIVELEDIATQFSSDLEYSKNYDDLTGLPNQGLFFDRIRQSIERGGRHDHLTAVLIIDIEMFSEINARLGKTGGDGLLKKVAERLNSIVRKSDGVSRLSVSRFAGDEFAVLFTDLPQKEHVTWAVKRLMDIINQPIDIDGNIIHLACHIGISLYPTDADSVESLLNNAMSAKHYSKKHKSEFNYQFYDHHVHELSVKHLHLETELRSAIENEEWILQYQPKLDVGQRKIIGVEALIRWNHPQRGLCYPLEFIEFAEQRGLIEKIGDWVIREACRQLRSWMDQGIPECKIAVNISSVQLGRSGFVEKILNCLEEFKVPPRLFEIEITETLMMEDVVKAIENLEQLYAQGISIAIDDFGTGYSSLSYLKSLPINSLKIDRVFVHDICTDENDQKIVQTMVSMAHSMGIKVVAEGVETREQFDLLCEYAVDEIQGYLMGRPVAPEEIAKLMLTPGIQFPSSENIVQMRS